MKTVTLIAHQEGRTWWADSVDLPEYFAAADSVVELIDLIKEGLAIFFDAERVRVRLALPSSTGFNEGTPSSVRWTGPFHFESSNQTVESEMPPLRNELVLEPA